MLPSFTYFSFFSRMRSLILTDNAFALEMSRELANRFGDIDIRQSRGGTLQDLPVIDARRDIDRIIRDYGLVISIHCRQFFPASLVNAVRCVNVHPGFNPSNRGWFPQIFSLINGKPAGVTIHEMDEQLDHGPIIVQEEVQLRRWDTSGSAYRRIMLAERRLLMANFPMIRDGTYETYSPGEGNLNTKEDFERLKRIDLNETGTFADFLNRLRALTHNEVRNAYFDDDSGQKVFVRVILEPEKQFDQDD
jgi:methionyl-tRNA formyltransferase